jgi:hypothetical protein
MNHLSIIIFNQTKLQRMKIFEQIQLLQRIDRLIRLKATGTPQLLGDKLKLSERQARRMIDDMKGLGLPISYCKQQQSYYYESEVFMKFEIFAVMGDERKKIIGGTSNNLNFLNIFFTRTFFDRDKVQLCSRLTNNGFSHLAGGAEMRGSET